MIKLSLHWNKYFLKNKNPCFRVYEKKKPKHHWFECTIDGKVIDGQALDPTSGSFTLLEPVCESVLDCLDWNEIVFGVENVDIVGR